MPLVSALARAEDALFRAGAAWWKRWKARRGVAIEEPTFIAEDVAGVHAVACRKQAATNATPLVCLHGYGSGTGMYYNSLAPLADSWEGEVYVLDSPGCGLSDRPKWRLPSGLDCPLSDAEGFWLERFEAWRAAKGFDRIALCGHSVGGYLAVAYCEKYPNRVERLVLASPVGLPPTPPAMVPGTQEAKEVRSEMPLLVKTVFSAWERGWGPFPFVRWGPGRWLMRVYVGQRFREAGWQDKEMLAEYFRLNLKGEPSWGAHAHAMLLLPGAYARSPLAARIAQLDFSPKGVKAISFVYGGGGFGHHGDWMNYRHAVDLQAATTSDGRPLPVEVALVAGAGHNLMADNPIGFVEAVAASGKPRGRGFDGVIFGEAACRLDVADRAMARGEPPAGAAPAA